MKKIIALILSSILLANTSFATYTIIYDNDGTQKYSTDDSGRKYYYDNINRNCYYYQNGNKVYYNSQYNCQDYNQSNGDYFYHRNMSNNVKDQSIDYKFSHFPADMNSVKYSSDYYPSIRYKGYTSAEIRYITDNDIDDIKDFVDNLGYFKFFKFGYYRDNAIDMIDDNRIDLSDLQKKKLSYPIAGVYVKETMLLFIYKDNLSKSEKDTIGQSYKSSSFSITKHNNWYIASINTSRDSSWTYQPEDYFTLFKKAYRNYNVLTFQVGENPFNNYMIQDFGDDILQLEILRNNLMYGFILSLKRDYAPTPISNSTVYGEDYSQDADFMQTLQGLYSSVYEYYRTMGGLPNNISSMDPTFFDITTFNPDNYDVTYYKTSNTCYKIGFKPQDTDFKLKYSSSINSDGYRMSSFCVK